MSDAVNHVLNAALTLQDEEQKQRIAALLSAAEERGLHPFEEEWLVEADRRSAEFDAGGVAAIPWAEVKSRARRGTAPDA